MNRLKTKKYILLVTAASLTAALLLSSCGGSAPETVVSGNSDLVQTGEGTVFDESKSKPAGTKEESVSVKADASGKPLEVTSSVVLSRIGDSEFIKDSSDLANIRNKEGDEEYEQKGTQLLWENKGENITYEGDSLKTPDVGVEVSYYLNGKKVSPEEIAGQSGDVRLSFHYINNAKQSVEFGGTTTEMMVPYLFMTVAVLDENHFSDVEVENGTTSTMGDMLLVAGLAAPGLKRELGLSGLDAAKDIKLPEYVEITAKATDFQLDFTTTIVSSGLFKDLETDQLKDGEDLVDSMKELRNASSEMLNGIAALSDGASEFDKALKSYTDGAADLGKGTKALSDGANALNSSGQELKNGADQLAEGLSGLNEMLQNMEAPEETDYGETFASLDQAIAALESDIQIIETAHPAPAEGEESTEEEVIVQQAITEAKGYLGMLKGILQAIEEGLPSADGEQLETLKTMVAALAEGASGLNTGLDQYLGGVEQLAGGAGDLQKGAEALGSGGSELYKGYGALTEGISKLKEGYAAFDEEGIAELSKLAGDDLKNVLNRIRAMKEIDTKSMNYSGAEESTKASVSYIIETEKVEK